LQISKAFFENTLRSTVYLLDKAGTGSLRHDWPYIALKVVKVVKVVKINK
jgi:hypothetical protein